MECKKWPDQSDTNVGHGKKKKMYTHDDFDSAVSSSMQDACHTWTQLNDFDLLEFP